MLDAANSGRADDLLALLDEGPDTRVNEKRLRGISLICAAHEGHADCVRVLVECGADQDAKDAVR